MAARTSIEAFYRDHGDAVFAYLLSLSRNRSDAEDLMQDTFMKATRSLGGYRGGSPRAWLFAIARSVFIDSVRRRPPIPVAQPTDRGRCDPDIADADAVRRAIARIPERQRSALLLSDQIGLPADEVGEALGVSPGAARVLIHRGRRAFRMRYEQDPS